MCSRQVLLLRVTSKKSRFPGDNGARGAPPIGISPTLALSLVLSIGGVLGDGALRRSFNPADILPSCSSGWGREVLLLPLQASLPRLLLWWRSLQVPLAGGTLHTGAPSRRSRPVPRSVVLYVPALLPALLTVPMISLLPGR